MVLFSIKNLSFSYGQSTEKALKNITLEISEGEFAVIFGKSGSGKSTLLNRLKPSVSAFGKSEGDIFYMGNPLSELDFVRQSRDIGFVMQNPDEQLVCTKVWQELAFGLENLGTPASQMRIRIAETANFFGIDSWFERDVNTLSGGQKQLLSLAGVMVMQPKVLILDEPTAQLDPIAAEEFLSAVRKINSELGTCVIIAEHNLEGVLPYADKAVFMEDGQILEVGSSHEILAGIKNNHPEFLLALPCACQIFFGLGETGNAPFTVKQARSFLDDYIRRENISFPHEAQSKPYRCENTALRLKNVYFRYEKNSDDVLKGADFELEKGKLTAIIGGNGSGKTTLLKIMCGLLKPYDGKVAVSDNKKIVMLPQNPRSIFAYNTVREELLEMDDKSVDFKARLEDGISRYRLADLLSRHPYDLSGGEIQRAALCKIMLSMPDIVFLDEPTKGMDITFKLQFKALLQRLLSKNISVVMVSHDLEFCAQCADLVAMFFDGKIIACDTPQQFFSSNRFYTTASARISRGLMPCQITREGIVSQCLKK